MADTIETEDLPITCQPLEGFLTQEQSDQAKAKIQALVDEFGSEFSSLETAATVNDAGGIVEDPTKPYTMERDGVRFRSPYDDLAQITLACMQAPESLSGNFAPIVPNLKEGSNITK